MSSTKGIFHCYLNGTPVSPKMTLSASTAGGIFQYQHKGYFRDKSILQTASKAVFNCRAERFAFASFSLRYNGLFHYYNAIKERSSKCELIGYASLLYSKKAVTDNKVSLCSGFCRKAKRVI